MRKLFLITAVSFSTILAACAESSEKKANREYVNAAGRVAAAEKAFNDADFSKARILCVEAKNGVEKIVETYPDSALALKIVSDASMLVGPCKYVDLRSSIIPRLELFDVAQMRPVELAWVLAVEKNAYSKLASALIDNREKFGDEICDKLFDYAVSKVDSAIEKSALRARYLSEKMSKKTSTVASAPALKKENTVEKIKDTAAFLRDASTAASLASFDLRASDKLRDMAKKARYADKETVSKFGSYLSLAYDNILKISAPSSKEKALASIAIAFADFGEDLRAIAISQKITSGELFYEVFKVIGENASGGANFKEALSLAPRLKDAQERGKFLSALAVGVAKQGLFAESRKIAAMVDDIPLRNTAYAGAAKVAFVKGNLKEASNCIASIDIKSLNCLSIFDEFAEGSKTALSTGERLALLSFKLADVSPKLSEALNNIALAEVKSSNTPNGKLLKIVFDNFAKLGKSDVALSLVSDNYHRVNVSIFKDSVSALAKNSKDVKVSSEAYSVLFDLYKSEDNLVGFAVVLAANGVPRAEATKILSDFLPKFSK